MCDDWITETYVNDLRHAANKYYLAIKRVRELHENHDGKCLECSVFVDDGITYPCSTIKVLDGE